MKKTGSAAIEVFKYRLLILSIVYVIVVSAMLGSQGAGYLGITLAFLSVCISLHSAWLSSVVAKYVRSRNVRNQYKNGEKFLQGALVYVLLTGAVWGALLLIFGDKLGNVLIRDVHIGFCMKLIAPVMILYAITESIVGYFKGTGMLQPVKISLLMREAVFFVCGIVGMKVMSAYGEKIAKLLHNEAVTYVYGAFGVMLGLLAGNAAELLILLIFRGLLHGELRRMKAQDTARHRETLFGGFRSIFTSGIFQGLRWFLLIAPLPVNYILYIRICKKDVNSTAWIKTGGYLFGAAVPVMLVLVTGFVLLNFKNYRQLAQFYRKESYLQFREKFSAMLLGVFALLLPVCAALAVMAEPTLKLLLGISSKEGSRILMFAAIGAVFITLEIIALRIMQIYNEGVLTILSLLGGFAAQTVLSVVIFKSGTLGSSGIFLGMLIQTGAVSVLFFLKFARQFKFSAVFLKKIIMTGIIALASALMMLLIYQIAGKKLPAAAVLPMCAIPGFLLYFAAMTFLHIIDSEEAEIMPGGALFLYLNRLLQRE